MDYKYKYIKYKTKYLNAKKLLGGNNNRLKLLKMREQMLNNDLSKITDSKKKKQMLQKIKNIKSEINSINLEFIKQNNFTAMENHISTYSNKTIDYLYDGYEYDQFERLIKNLKTKNIIPKIVFIVGHGVVNQELNELITYEQHKIVELYKQLIEMKVDNVFIVKFIESIINYNKNKSITNQEDLLKSINDFKEDIPELWNAYSEKQSFWRLEHDSFYYLMYSSETKILNNDKKLTMSFTEPGDGLFIIGTNSETNDDYYHFIKIPTHYEKQKNLNTNYQKPSNNFINLRNIINLFDIFDSSIYFIPVSCQNIVNEKPGDQWENEDDLYPRTPKNPFLIKTNKLKLSPFALDEEIPNISELELPK